MGIASFDFISIVVYKSVLVVSSFLARCVATIYIYIYMISSFTCVPFVSRSCGCSIYTFLSFFCCWGCRQVVGPLCLPGSHFRPHCVSLSQGSYDRSERSLTGRLAPSPRLVGLVPSSPRVFWVLLCCVVLCGVVLCCVGSVMFCLPCWLGVVRARGKQTVKDRPFSSQVTLNPGQ